MFIGREYEIDSLNKLYLEEKFQFIVMYGRRRIGKTRILSEFCKDKDSIFFVSEEYNDNMALERFSRVILEHFNFEKYMSKFDTWENAFLFIADRCKEEKLVLVMDEFPYIARANKSIPSLLQNLIDHHLKDTKLQLIICGSSMSFMEKEILSYKSPLYGRRTAQYKIEAFNYFESANFFPEYSFEDKLLSYAILGGIPQYLLKFSDTKSIRENVIEYVLDKSSYLSSEPYNLLKQELREPALYNTIIETIATGATKINEISTKVGEPTAKCSLYIKTLIELEIIEKRVPIGEDNSKKGIYLVKDNFFKFWYKYVFKYPELIEQEMLGYIYDNIVEPDLSMYISFIYESVCIDFLKIQNKEFNLPFVFEKIGPWWGNNSIKKRQEEIDILAINGENALIGECKWRNDKLNIQTVNELIEKSYCLKYDKKHYVFFSKSGFTEDVIKYAKLENNITLYGKDLIKVHG